MVSAKVLTQVEKKMFVMAKPKAKIGSLIQPSEFENRRRRKKTCKF